MTTKLPVIPPLIIGRCVDKIRIPYDSLSLTVNYDYGRQTDIVKRLITFDNAEDFKSEKYPLIAMVIPISVVRGLGPTYGTVKIPRIVLATVSSGTDHVSTRYQDTESYQKILYPMYYEFLKQLAASPEIQGQDVDSSFPHTQVDNPARQPIGQGLNDFIDSIEILNLELKLIQIKNC